MAAVISDLLVTFFVAAIGIIFGWWIRGAGRGPTTGQGPAEAANRDVHQAREILARLREVAASVAADVGQHSQRVEQINEELTASGASDTEAVVGAVARLLQSNRQMQHRLDSAEERLQDQARQIECHATEARTDPLTGLANRRALDAELSRRLAEFGQLHKPFWMLMLDVDHFKRFNDTHGHQAGDEVLRGVAGLLRRTSRSGDLVARYGGEELVILFAGSQADAVRASERTREAIEQARFRFDGSELRVTASFGLAQILPDEDGPGLMRRADEALYASKKGGRNCIHWHDGQQIQRVGGHVPPSPPKAGLPRNPGAAGRGEVSVAPPQPASLSSAASKPASPASPASPAAPPPLPAEPAEATEPRLGVQVSLPNRTAFCTVLSSRLAEWRRGGASPGVLLVKVDRYEEIAARGGQHVGHVVLRDAIRCLTATLRGMDMVAHYDQATFAVLLPGAELPVGIRVAERLRQEIAGCELSTDHGLLRLTASIGGAEALVSDDSASLMRRAEESLDAATRSGGDCCYFHNGQWSETAAAALEKAIGGRAARAALT